MCLSIDSELHYINSSAAPYIGIRALLASASLMHNPWTIFFLLLLRVRFSVDPWNGSLTLGMAGSTNWGRTMRLERREKQNPVYARLPVWCTYGG